MKIILLKIWILAAMSFFIQNGQTQNLLTDGNFSSTTAITPYTTDPPPLKTWCSWINPAYISPEIAISISNGVCSYSWRNVSLDLFDVQLIQWGFPLVYGHHYRLTFDIMADADRYIGVFLGENGGSWRDQSTNLISYYNYIQPATTVWQTRVIEFDATTVFALNKLSFDMGIWYSTMYLKNIILEDAGVISKGVCLTKFYDANVNGYRDNGEQPIEGVIFTLAGTNFKQTQTTGSDGKASFTNMPNGRYVVKEKVPHGYLFTTPDSQMVDINSNSAVVNFGNVCLGGGGARDREYWTSKKGEEKLVKMGMETQLALLRNLNLRNRNGNDFDPYSYKDLRKWMRKANEKNIAYPLSVQMAVMYLNLQAGFVDTSSIIYAHGFGNIGINNNFINIYSLVWQANSSLRINPVTKEKTASRKNQAYMLYGLWEANANMNFIQKQPCSRRHVDGDKEKEKPLDNIKGNVVSVVPVILPNPTNNYFTLRPANDINAGQVQLRVFDANGKLVYTNHWSSNKDCRFGDNFISGLYYVEVIQGSNRFTYKLIKQ